MLKIDCLCYTCQVCQIKKKESTSKKYGLLPPKIVETDTVSLRHGQCGSGGSINNKETSQKNSLLTLTMIDSATGWFETREAPK
jgi:hypothetical protein